MLQESEKNMADSFIPKNYKPELNLYNTQIAIKTVKDFFQSLLAERLHLLRVSAPLFVAPESGLNDNLNGVERPVTFDIKCQDGREGEIVQSLAKWKRYALKKYGFSVGEGLYTDMSAIRRDEQTDNIHSGYRIRKDYERRDEWRAASYDRYSGALGGIQRSCVSGKVQGMPFRYL